MDKSGCLSVSWMPALNEGQGELYTRPVLISLCKTIHCHFCNPKTEYHLGHVEGLIILNSHYNCNEVLKALMDFRPAVLYVLKYSAMHWQYM